MRKTPYLFGILLAIIIGILLNYFLCNNCNKSAVAETQEIEKKVVEPVVKEATIHPFIIKDANGNFAVNANDNFNFNASNYHILKPISENVDANILKLKEYFDANKLKRLNITGYYTSDEKNNSAYPNLGLARANAVKNYLSYKGISPKYVNTYGKLNDQLVPNADNVFFGPVDFSILTREKGYTDEKLKAKCQAIVDKPLVLYFKTGESYLNLTPEQRQKFADISRCVDKLGVKVRVVGHTDNTGNPKNNIVLGQKRADFVKKYLVRNGILSENIEAISKGQSEPIADNNTEQGKAKNRRTVVTISKN